MHFGTLPLDYEPGRSYLDVPAAAKTHGPDGVTRRSLFAFAPLALGFVGGTAAGAGILNLFDSGVGPAAPERTDAPIEPGSVEWALWIQDGPESELLDAAGELERVRMNSRGDARLTPVFVRLLSVSLASDQPTADQAGAIAVRCLDRLGADHHLLVLDDSVLDRDDRPATARELKAVLRRDREGRK